MSPLQTLKAHADRIRAKPLSTLGAQNVAPMLKAAGWQADLSRHYVDARIWSDLLQYAEDTHLQAALDNLFAGAVVNPSENRPALHWALRDSDVIGEAEDIYASTHAALQYAKQIIQTGRFKAIVHIGIGGSDFGPRLLADALSDAHNRDLDIRFCANVDPLDLDLALEGLDPSTTLIIGISKSFGTEETLYNLSRARTWLEQKLGAQTAPDHLVLVTANPDRARDWLNGADVATLHLPLSVGGRYSIWSAASAAIMILLGVETFSAILRGAQTMDTHVRTTPIAGNLAARLALLDFWNTRFMGFGSRAVLAYSRRLRLLPTYLQQLEMESNGKSVTPSGHSLEMPSAPLLWGGEGSIGQHSYHQWLHQGTHIVPTEFILAPGSHSDAVGVTALTAHALAQAEVLANGRSLDDVKREEPDLSETVAAQKVHPGGRPSSFVFTPELTAERLGALIALYEHRTYLAGVLWGVNSFDQWGVERGKTMAGILKTALDSDARAADPVTQRLIDALKG